METILIVDDDKKITRILEIQLKDAGYDVLVAHNGQEAVKTALSYDVDLVLMDIAMPIMNGVEAMKLIKEQKNVPVVLLTARDDTNDIVEGLDTGADEYITKPFVFDELAARLRARIRAHKNINTNEPVVTEYRGIHLDTTDFTTTVNGENCPLSKTEFDLLKYLIEKKGTVVSRDQLLKTVWGYTYGGSNNVDVYINYIRKKLAQHVDEEIIETVRGRGYIVR